MFFYWGDNMCKHDFIEMNNTKACIKCGMTVLANGKIIFDKELVNYINKGKK